MFLTLTWRHRISPLVAGPRHRRWVANYNMFFVYIIQSQKTNKYYIGYTKDVEDRLSRHNRGLSKSTKPGIPWKLIYKEAFETKIEAWNREQQIKRYKGGEAFKKLINGGIA